MKRRSILGLAALLALLAVLVWAVPASSITPPFVEGDANCDGIRNSIDAAIVLQFDAALIDSVPCPVGADVNLDGAINSVDAAIILQREAGLLARCPVGQSLGLVAELTTNGTTFSQGEAVSMALSITNCGSQPVNRRYSSSQLFDFDVRQASGLKVWHWSHGLGFLAVITERTFQPGERVTYTAVWNQVNNDGREVPPGRYEVLGIDVGCSDESLLGCHFGAGVNIEITP